MSWARILLGADLRVCDSSVSKEPFRRTDRPPKESYHLATKKFGIPSNEGLGPHEPVASLNSRGLLNYALVVGTRFGLMLPSFCGCVDLVDYEDRAKNKFGFFN